MNRTSTSARLATLETDGWTIDDGEQAHAAHPERYRIPPRRARMALGPGDLVKIRFYIRVRTETGETEDQGERMWVEIQERHGDWYLGTLDNDPCCTDAIQSGMPLWFQARHVIDIDLGPLSRRRFRKMKAARWVIASLSLMALCVFVSLCTDHGQAWLGYWQSKLRGGYRLEERLGQLAPEVEPGLRQVFAAADVAFPPAELSLLAFKRTRTLEVYARSEAAGPWRYVATLPVLGLSGQPGPKKHADVDAHEQGRRRNRLAITTLGVVLLGIEVLILMNGMPWVEFLCLLAGTLLALRYVLRKA